MRASKESTGMDDMHGEEIFVGDIVKKQHGFWRHPTWNDPMKRCFKFHRVTKRCHENITRYQLGDLANYWSGKDVEIYKGERNTIPDIVYEDIN